MNNENNSQCSANFDPPCQESLENIKSVSQRADELLLAERFAEAEQLYRELCLGLEVLLGPAHPDVAEAKHKLAAALGGQGKTAEAVANEQSSQILKAALK
ncbi:MAG: tetratricopeptide repeat protein [Cyanobacteria bacterium SZAS-4]|nr:tetratricopeptide repeat protein [Cyanobacteria bacterium SZAS-4]